MTEDIIVTPEMLVARQFSSMSFDQRLADVCQTCGLHTILDLQQRIQAIYDRSPYHCSLCNRDKEPFDGGQTKVQEEG